ncbi:MAG TPA: hypothetical protein VH619_19060, partial [Verrucomicrobiae bacterium]|nr:hypothetical protein [Verrucomicrobiae bacterium]
MKSHAAAISWTNTAGGNWSGAVNWSPNQVPGSADDAAITNGGSYTVTLDISVTVNSLVVGGNGGGLQSFTINGPTLSVVVAGTVNESGSLTLDGGLINGAGALTLNGTNAWNGGQFGSGGGVEVTAFGTLYIGTGNDHNMPGLVLNNLGTIIRTGGRIRGGSGGVVNNGGLWVEETDNVFNQDFGGASSQFINTGTYRKTTTGGTSTFESGFQLLNNGLVDAQTGTIEIVDGGGSGDGTWNADTNATCYFDSGYVMNDGSAFTGAGTNALNGGITFTGRFMSENLQWQSGAIGGDGTNVSGSTLYITTGNDHNMPGAVLNNLGTVIRTGGRVRSGGGGVVTNVGLWVEETDNVFNQDYGGTASQFINLGTYRKTTTTGASAFLSGFQLVNAGLVDAESGTIEISDGGGSGNGTWNAAANAVCDF